MCSCRLDMEEDYGLSSVSLTSDPGPGSEVTVFTTSYKIMEQPAGRNIILGEPSIGPDTATAIEISEQVYTTTEDTEDLTLQLILGSEKIKFCPVCGKQTGEMSELSSHLGKKYLLNLLLKSQIFF